ncbi:hypothetical protein BH10PSE4_BH10PSE4_07210 [soil metagenome]
MMFALACTFPSTGLGAEPVPAKLDREGLKPAFSAEFDGPPGQVLDIWSPDHPKGVWKTDYYFGAQRDRRGQGLTPAQAFSARTIPGELQIYVDPDYCGVNPFSIADGALSIWADRATGRSAMACGQGAKHYTSGVITTEKSFRPVYGYFEVRARMPGAWGTWPAFWLLPVEKTPENAGRLPEIDVFEHYSGPHPTVQVRPGVPLDRTGVAGITVHVGRFGSEQSLRPKNQPRTTTTTAFHTYGVLWTPTELVFYLDDVETWRTPFTYDKPMYMLLNLAVSDKTAGNPDKAEYPAALVIDYVRAWSLP